MPCLQRILTQSTYWYVKPTYRKKTMNTPPNARLQLFVDSVMTYYAQLIINFTQNITVNYNPHNRVFWFVLTRDRGMIEQKYVDSIDELDAIPRMVQVGWVDSTPDSPLLLVFFNERGVYTKGMPHTLPTATCSAHQAKEAAQTVFNYLTTGSFTGEMQYGVMRSMQDKVVTPVVAPPVFDLASVHSRMAIRAAEVFTPATTKKPFEYFESFKVNNRIKKALIAKFIYFPRALGRYTEEDLLKIHGIGPKSVEQIKAALAATGLKLKVKRKKKA
jgi:hypothetical protein